MAAYVCHLCVFGVLVCSSFLTIIQFYLVRKTLGYTIQLIHYSHFKTHSLQHLKPIKCQKRVCKYQTPTCFGLFFTTILRGSSAVPCAVTIPHADLRSLSLYYYAVCGRMCISSVRVWCSCLFLILNNNIILPG